MSTHSPVIDQEAVEAWLERFAVLARSAGAESSFDEVFLADVYWRDGLALTWQLTTWYGQDQIREGLQNAHLNIESLEFEPELEMQWASRNGLDHIEVPYRFTTAIGQGRGYARLVEYEGRLVAWTVSTILETITGHEEAILANRPSGNEYARTFSGPNWLDKLETERKYDDREPEVLVAGGGQAGLTAAARLRQLGVDVLVVDPMKRVGDNWRNRYHSLTLHNEAEVCHLPYMPFPETWPTYIPKDMVALWFEAYAKAMELNFWGGARLVSGEYNHETETWGATVRFDDGTERVLHPKHIVMATGVSGKPIIPDIAGMDDFQGEIIHTSDFYSGKDYRNKRVLVVGTGSSGHDTAQELHGAGAEVTMMQKSATAVVSSGIETAGKLYAPYMKGRPTEETDLKSASTPYPLNRHSMQLLTRSLKVIDRSLHEGLEAAGFRITHGEDDLGFAGKFFGKFGGYYLDVGCSQLIIDGEIRIIQHADFEKFVSSGASMKAGDIHEFDVIVLATGYEGQDSIAGQLFGDEVRQKIGAIWGFDEQGEMRNMWRPTAQKGLWIAGGGFAQSRINSKFIALQIKGRLLGMVPESADAPDPLGQVRPADVCDVTEFQSKLIDETSSVGANV